MKSLSIMIKPASSLCNLRCKYCFYADESRIRSEGSFGVMDQETTEELLAQVRRALEPGSRVVFAFQGGEPTLAGLAYFRRFTELVKAWDSRVQVDYAFQTNGILLDDDWCAFFAAHDFLVGISLDCVPEVHDAARVDPTGKGTYRAVVRALRLLNKHRVSFNVLCTLTSPVARHPQKVWNLMEKMDIRYIQFTPCLEELCPSGANPYALTPELFAGFYRQLFPSWYRAFRQGNYRSVKLFDDIVNLLAYQMPTACGINGVCQPQLIVESNGNVYPCDFYCLDEYLLGNIRRDSLEVLTAASARSPSKVREPLPKICSACRYRPICGGGCKRMRNTVYFSQNDTFCGYRDFLDESMAYFTQIARQQLRFR